MVGLKVQKGADVEKLLRHLVKADPSGKSLKLDVAKAGDVDIHQIIPDPNQPLDENVKRLIGDNPDIYFAIRDDAILLAGGPNAVGAEGGRDGQAEGRPDGPGGSVDEPGGPAGRQREPGRPAIAKKVFTSGVKQVPRQRQGGKKLSQVEALAWTPRSSPSPASRRRSRTSDGRAAQPRPDKGARISPKLPFGSPLNDRRSLADNRTGRRADPAACRFFRAARTKGLAAAAAGRYSSNRGGLSLLAIPSSADAGGPNVTYS